MCLSLRTKNNHENNQTRAALLLCYYSFSLVNHFIGSMHIVNNHANEATGEKKLREEIDLNPGHW